VVEEQHESIKMFIRLKDQNHLTIKDLESRALRPLLLIYQAIQALFKDSNVLDVDFELSKDKLGSIFKSILGLPNTFISLQKNNKIEIQQVIKTIIPEI